ncbi:MAG: hypothetical protein DWQ37_18460 [Planctomycetota bacterium]|nr:MAG: hypothetical protein DWQ37_18460 [Planctomycetota bacterium]
MPLNQPNGFSCARMLPRLAAAFLCGLLAVAALFSSDARAQTVARQWNEALLDAIRIDFPAPTVHSRNLYHSSAAMYDAWAAYDNVAQGQYFTEKHTSANVAAARQEAISYAAYRVLSERYTHAVNPVASQTRFDAVMDNLGYDKNYTSTVGNSPAAVGNRIAQHILSSTINDGSNEANGYVDNTGYQAVNTPMIVDYPSVTNPQHTPLADPNRWQPLYIESQTLQNGIPVGFNLQQYVGPHWGSVETFAMGRDGTSGPHSWSDIDPGAPPQLGGVGDAAYRANTRQLIEFSSKLDPTHGGGAEMVNLSPGANGNRPLGTHDNQGYAVNPSTGQPYADNWVKQADYGRVLAEYWADGPHRKRLPATGT